MILNKTVELQKSKCVCEYEAIFVESILVGQNVSKEIQFGYL